MVDNIFFITGNKHKFLEVQQIIPAIQQLDIHLPEIQELNPQEIIKHKLAVARERSSEIIAVEDVSLTLENFGGLPGPLIKWFLAGLKTAGFAQMAIQTGHTRAVVAANVGVSWPDGRIRFFTGTIRGLIVRPKGESEFAFDPIFQPDGLEKTFAELGVEQKNIISHRAMAWKQVLTTFQREK